MNITAFIIRKDNHVTLKKKNPLSRIERDSAMTPNEQNPWASFCCGPGQKGPGGSASSSPNGWPEQ